MLSRRNLIRVSAAVGFRWSPDRLSPLAETTTRVPLKVGYLPSDDYRLVNVQQDLGRHSQLVAHYSDISTRRPDIEILLSWPAMQGAQLPDESAIPVGDHRAWLSADEAAVSIETPSSTTLVSTSSLDTPVSAREVLVTVGANLVVADVLSPAHWFDQASALSWPAMQGG